MAEPPAGSSGTPLPRKLGFKSGMRAAIVRAPAGFASALGTLPEDVDLRWTERDDGPLDLVLVFATEAAEAEAAFARAVADLAPAGMLWIAWPKKASRVPTELSDGRVREVGLAAGLVDVKVCAVDAAWSGLKFVRRVADRVPVAKPGGRA